MTSMPPLEPADERQAPGDAAFVASCREALDNLNVLGRLKLGAQLLTHSASWGLVWRADFEMSEGPVAPLINRIVCWKDNEGRVALMLAIGQDVPPL